MASPVAEGMVDIVTPPIFVADMNGLDVIVFRSAPEAEAFIEPPDVIHNDVIAFDGLGRRLGVELHGTRTRIFVPDDSANSSTELLTRIRRLSNAENLHIDASPDEWETFIEAATTAIESWMHRE